MMRIRRAGTVAGAIVALLLVAGCAQEAATNGGEAPPTSGGADETQEKPQDDTPQEGEATGGRDIVESPPEHSWTDALDRVREESDGDLIKVELEPRNGGKLTYTIEVVEGTTQLEYDLDANSLEQVELDRDDISDDPDEQSRKTFEPGDVMALDDAAAAARDAQSGTITEWSIEGTKSGSIVYEFTIMPDGSNNDVEVTLDAMDGSVLEIDD